MHNRLMNGITIGLAVYCVMAGFFLFGKKEGATQAVNVSEACCQQSRLVACNGVNAADYMLNASQNR